MARVDRVGALTAKLKPIEKQIDSRKSLITRLEKIVRGLPREDYFKGAEEVDRAIRYQKELKTEYWSFRSDCKALDDTIIRLLRIIKNSKKQ